MEITLNINRGNSHPIIQYDSPGTSIGFVNRIGLDGSSAYQIAVDNGFQGNERQWLDSLAEPALEAAQKADAAVGKLEVDLSHKADLDADTGYLLSGQTDPFEHLKGGVSTSEGYFLSEGPYANFRGDRTLEMLFTLNEDRSQEQTIFRQISGTTDIFKIYIRNNYIITYFNGTQCGVAYLIRFFETYHLVFCYSEHEKTARIYINGVLHSVTQISDLEQVPEKFGISSPDAPFKGIVHLIRMWNICKDTEGCLELWNYGKPSLSISDLKPGKDPRESAYEYLPAGITAGRWKNSILTKSDLLAYGAPVLSAKPVSDLNRIILDTGVFYTDIAAGISYKSILYPNGYYIEKVAIYNMGEENLTSVSAYCALKSYTYIRGATLRTTDPIVVSSGTSGLNSDGTLRLDGLTLRGSGNQIWVNATGNREGMGIKVKVICRYIGLW